MVPRQQSRPGSALWAMFFGATLLMAPAAASADPLDEPSCQRLRTERQALMVLGIDKHIEKGAGWAKERLTVADLNLVKRYLDVYEQIKFRCDKIVALVEPEEKDEDDDENAADGAAPPMPERKSGQPVKSSAAPDAAPAPAPQLAPGAPLVRSNTAAKTGKAPIGSSSFSASQAGAVAPPR